MKPYHSFLSSTGVVIIFQVDMLSGHKPFARIDRLSEDTGFCESTHSHLVRPLTAVLNKGGCDAASLIVRIAEADVKYWYSGTPCQCRISQSVDDGVRRMLIILACSSSFGCNILTSVRTCHLAHPPTYYLFSRSLEPQSVWLYRETRP